MKTIVLATLLASASALVALAPAASAYFCTTDDVPVHQCGGVLTYGGCAVELSGAVDACVGGARSAASTGICAGDYQVIGDGCFVDTRDAGVYYRDCHDGSYQLWIGNARGPCGFLP